MTNLITYSDFSGTINIDTSRVEVKEVIAEYITEYQEKFLIKLLGISLYNDLLSYDVTSDKYKDLINGISSTFNWDNKNRRYIGVKRMLACFIYPYYVRESISGNALFAEVQPNPSNGSIVENRMKFVHAYNEAVKLYTDAIIFIQYKNQNDSSYYANFKPEVLKPLNSWGL